MNDGRKQQETKIRKQQTLCHGKTSERFGAYDLETDHKICQTEPLG